VNNRIVLRSAGGLAAAALVVLVVLGLWPWNGGIQRASAEAIQTAMQLLERVDAIAVSASVDSGAGTPVEQSWTGVGLRDVGFRLSSADGVLVYNHREQRQYQFNGDELVVTELRDATSLGRFLDRFTADQSLQYVKSAAMRSGGQVSDELVESGGRTVRRLAVPDERGHLVVVELDSITERLVRCETWTIGEVPAARQVWTFEYPGVASIDPDMFAVPKAEGRPVRRESDERRLCMVNIRNLCMAVQIYASEHEDRLPPKLSDLGRYLPDADFDGVLVCTDLEGKPARIVYRGPEQQSAVTLAGLDSQAILFECQLPTGRILGFADTRTEFRANERP
jgi:hypothetical protein